MTDETLTSEGPDPWAGTVLPTGVRRRAGRTARVAAAMTTAAAVVLAGGVVTAAIRAGGGSDADPATVVPATTFAFAQIDLDPNSSQATAVGAIARRFPHGPWHGSGSLRDALLGAMFKDSSDPHIDYASDVKPWLGNHAAVAGIADSAGKPQVVYLLQSTDDAKARTALRKLAPSQAVAFSHGYAVLASNQERANAVVTAAHSSTLADSPHYRADIATLPSGELATGWADLAGAVKVLAQAFGGFGLSMLPKSGLVSSNATGRLVAGLSAGTSYAQITFREIGVKHTTTTSSVPTTLLSHLPDGTIAAAELSHPGALISSALRGASLALAPFIAGRGVFGGTNGTTTIAPVRPSPFNPMNVLGDIERNTGLRLPQDATTLLGSAAVISYGGLAGGFPNIAIRSQPASLAAADAVLARVRAIVARTAKLHLATKHSGSDLVVATTSAYADTIAAGGSLASVPSFTTAMGGDAEPCCRRVVRRPVEDPAVVRQRQRRPQPAVCGRAVVSC